MEAELVVNKVNYYRTKSFEYILILFVKLLHRVLKTTDSEENELKVVNNNF